MNEKVWYNLLQTRTHGLAERTSRSWVQAGKFLQSLLQCLFRDIQILHDALPALVREVVVCFLQNPHGNQLGRCVGLAPQLQHQALLQALRPHPHRVKSLNSVQHPCQFFFRNIQSLIDGQFLHNGGQRFAQQTIVIQRTNEIFCHIVLLWGKVTLSQLLLHQFIERCGSGKRNLSDDFTCSHRIVVHRIIGNIVHGAIVTQCGQFLFTHFISVGCFTVFQIVLIGHQLPRHLIVKLVIGTPLGMLCRVGHLQRRIFQHFGTHTLLQSLGGKFQQTDKRQLVLRNRLMLLLNLFLNVFSAL